MKTSRPMCLFEAVASDFIARTNLIVFVDKDEKKETETKENETGSRRTNEGETQPLTVFELFGFLYFLFPRNLRLFLNKGLVLGIFLKKEMTDSSLATASDMPRSASSRRPGMEKGRSWRQLLSTSKKTSKNRQVSSRIKTATSTTSEAESVQNPTKSVRRRRKVKQRAHTMDNMATNINTTPLDEVDSRGHGPRSKSTPLPLSPTKKSSSKGSLLQRFLSMNSVTRRRSKTNISGEVSTVSRLTDEEPELGDVNSPSSSRVRRSSIDGTVSTTTRRNSKSPTPNSQAGTTSSPGGLGGFLRRFSGDGSSLINMKRRGSRDSIDFEYEEEVMAKDDYEMLQADLQQQADDFHKQGQLEESISKWLQVLSLAEEHQDTLARKTEFLCILVDLHLQASNRQHYDADGEAVDPAAANAGIKRHREEAERYLNRIKPGMVKPEFWSNTKELFDFLVKAECWELALLVAVRLADLQGGQEPELEQFATIHFHIASNKLDSNRQGEGLQHLQATVKYMQMIEPERRDVVMYLQVLDLIASEYHSQGQTALALDAYQESLKTAAIEKHASLYCRMAQIYLDSKQLDEALEQLEAAASSLDSAEPSIRLDLLQTKGDVYYRLGRMDESLQVYQGALEEVVNPADKAKLLYTLGRLCVRLKRFRLAISYFTREMEITEVELGKDHLSVSRVLHELAKLYDEGLGESQMALMKLTKALQIELAVLQECHYSITKCKKCNQVTHRMCPQHAVLQRDLSNQIRETKKAQGRIHFKLGDFERALQTSFDGTAERGRRGRGRRSSIA